jgi:hypothetical protein
MNFLRYIISLINFVNSFYYTRLRVQRINLTTEEVKIRLKAAFIPNAQNFLEIIRGNIDLFVPFWIIVTIIVILSVSGNLSAFLKVIMFFKYIF